MKSRITTSLAALIALSLLISVPVAARSLPQEYSKEQRQAASLAGVPIHERAAHRVNKLTLCVNNSGTFGTGFSTYTGVDVFTGQEVPSCEYPKGSNNDYLFAGAFWIGAVVGRDTLVSLGADGWEPVSGEFYPDEDPFGKMIRRSIIDPSKEEYVGAISEEDFVSVYFDTNTVGVDPDPTGVPHRPLHIQVTENSYAWSYGYAEDFILFDYQISNIGTQTLNDVYMGIYVDADVGASGDNDRAQDDVCGFVETLVSSVRGCEYLDTVNLAWIADNDGDFGEGGNAGTPDVTATRIVRTPSTNLDVSFNWWVSNTSPASDFGPRERPNKGRLQEDFRDFGTGGLGTPRGDKNKYYQLRNQEFDYSQVFAGVVGQGDTLWLPGNPSVACRLDTRYLLSFGPFEITPGAKLPISFAYVAGQDFHQDPDNLTNCTGGDPGTYLSNLSFADLGSNGRWASWIYDNPGVDTDGDGYAGPFVVCVLESTLSDSVWVPSRSDTVFTSGDGVPDFKGASPPPAPEIWVEPSEGEFHIRFNGYRSETTRDNFSRINDFEGYRIYMARDARPSSYFVIASYDKEDYNKWIFDDVVGEYALLDPPFTRDSLRCLYAASCSDSTFDPLTYDRVNPLRIGDSIFYFERQDYNVAIPGVNTDIRKTFPNQPFPSSLNPDSAQADELTEDGRFKYFEYYADIDNMLPTVPWFINVTAFDFGSPVSGLPSLETSVSIGSIEAYAQPPADSVLAKDLPVYVYPNPYRIDSDYRGTGFEGRGNADRPDDRVRAINFTNLPPKCTIRIYSLDGDLINEIKHDKDPADPTATHDQWSLITRNTQLVVSGLYYWTVEAPDGKTQIGKVMIIM